MSPTALSAATAAAATAVSLVPGVAAAWLIERGPRGLRGPLHAAVLMPLVLPPVVTGYLLLAFFSPRAALGRALAAAGVPVAFEWLGCVAAAAVVGFPFLVSGVVLALKAVDPRLEAVSRSLGRGPWETFLRITLPLAWPGILAGAALAFARALGEFGATIVLAGRIPGRTETLPLAVYAALERPGGEAEAWRLVWTALALGVLCLAASRFLDSSWRRRLEAGG